VRKAIAEHQRKAAKDRRIVEDLQADEEALDRDAMVAAALAREYEREHRTLAGRDAELGRRVEEIESDLARWDPDKQATGEEVIALRRALGEKLPGDEAPLLDLDGQPVTPPPVVVETDPARVEILRRQLADAQAKLQRLDDASVDLEAELDTVREQRQRLAPDLAAAEKRWNGQAERAASLKVESEDSEGWAVKGLEMARDHEVAAEGLTRDLPEIEKAWAAHVESHPEKPPIDLGEIVVTASDRERAEAHAQGRREDAAAAEQLAVSEDRAANRATDGARSRLALADIRDQEVADLNGRIERAASRSEALKAEGAKEMSRAEQLAKQSDQVRADAQKARAAGRLETAETLDARAAALTDESIKAAFRSDDLEREGSDVTTAATGDRQRVSDLERESTRLRAEADELRKRVDGHTEAAADSRAKGIELDRTAVESEQLLDTGEPFTVQVAAPDGTMVELHAGAPVPAEPDESPIDTESPDAQSPSTEPTDGRSSPGEPVPASFDADEASFSDPADDRSAATSANDSTTEPAAPTPVTESAEPAITEPDPPPAEDDGAFQVTSPHPIDHPDWLPPVWVAPARAIMDEQDMTVMRDKLRAGHDVVVSSDGHIRKSGEPVGPPMTEQAETFVESRLGEVRRLALEGIDTRISPDGSMAGAGRNSTFMYMAGPDRSFDEDEMNLIRSGILRGARVSVSPDGTVWMRQFPNDPPRTDGEAKAMLATFEQHVERGDFQRQLDEGLTVSVIGDEIQTAVVDDALPPAIEFVDPPSTGADARAAAEQAAETAQRTRQEGERRVADDVVELGLERDAVARKKWGAEQEAKAADQQVKRERRLAADQHDVADSADKAAARLAAQGDEIGATEKREEARAARVLEETGSRRAQSAADEAAKLRLEAEKLGEKVVAFDEQIERARDFLGTVDKMADRQDERARALASVADKLEEADRLTKDAAGFRSEGNESLADQAVREADALRQQADADRAGLDIEIADDDPATLGAVGGPEPVSVVGEDAVGPTPADSPVSERTDTSDADGFASPEVPAPGDVDADSDDLEPGLQTVTASAETDLELDVDGDLGGDPLSDDGEALTALADEPVDDFQPDPVDDLSPAEPLVADAEPEPDDGGFEGSVG
jgi:hypothetical protein